MSLPLAPPATAPRAAGAPTRPRKRSNLFTVRAGISRRTYWVLALTGLFTPLVLWAAVGLWGGIDPVFMPAPLQVLGFTLDELREARLAPIVSFKGRGLAADAVAAGEVGLS